MLGRRQLRAKVMQAIYAYHQSDNYVTIVEKNLLKGVDDLYDLYISLLNLIVEVKVVAQELIVIQKNKKLPTKSDLNPNYKFVNNLVFKLLEENYSRIAYSSKNSQLTWRVESSYPNNILKQILASESYAKYMENTENVFHEDKDFILFIFEEFIASNESLLGYLEEQNIFWGDDTHIANTMAYNTIKSFTLKSDGALKLFKSYKDEEDRLFTKQLFQKTIQNEVELKKIIKEKADNWDLERIAAIDLIILEMALCEFLYFTDIPAKVTINEYVEIAKDFSTDNSTVFVNGILDKAIKELTENNKILKYGKGLF